MIGLIILIILIFVNGIFSASELAFLSLDKYELENDIKNCNKKAIRVNKILNNPSKFLSTIQIGITLAGFFASAFAADYFADYFLNVININFISDVVLETILVIIITVILSYFTLVFGELVPKKIAINNPKKISYLFVNLITIVSIIFYPLIKILTISTEFICKVFKIKEKTNKLTEEDIKKMIVLGNNEGIVNECEKEYILNIFNFNDIDVTNVMTQKENVVMLDLNSSLMNNISIIKESKFTRFPIYKNNKDNIIGILNVKDLIMQHGENKSIDIEKLIRPVTKIQYNEKIDDVFRYMQENTINICVVYKNNKFIGIVTIEDAIEEIVGNIYDEYDKK